MRKSFCLTILIFTLVFVPFKLHKRNSIEFKLYNSSLKCIDGQVINIFKIKEHSYKCLIFENRCKYINSYNPPKMLLGIFVIYSIIKYILSKMYTKLMNNTKQYWEYAMV